LHAGVTAQTHQSQKLKRQKLERQKLERQKLERLCRTIARPAISEKRLSRSPQGRVRY